jgi:hypothetical protein
VLQKKLAVKAPCPPEGGTKIVTIFILHIVANFVKIVGYLYANIAIAKRRFELKELNKDMLYKSATPMQLNRNSKVWLKKEKN